jgi:large subunit ribosomal protein L12
MELVYAALLLHSMKKPIDETHVKKIVEAAGGEVDSARIKALVGSLHGVNIDEAIKQAAVAAVAAPAASGSHEKHEEKKEEESAEDQEKKAEEAAGGLSSLFG